MTENSRTLINGRFSGVKTILSKYLEDRYTIYGILIVLFFYGILHCFTKYGLLDDPIFAGYFEQYTLKEFLFMRYQTWSSRIFLEGTTALILQLPFFVWKICDTLAYVILFLSIRYALKLEGISNIFLAIAVNSYIMLQMASAGWAITSITYIWTLVCAWICLVFIRYSATKKISLLYLFVYCPIMLFACNNEVTASILLFVYFVLFIALYKTTAMCYITIGIILQFLSLLFVFTAPGNQARLQFANTPEYIQLSLFGKLRIGVVSTFEHFVSIPNILFGCFCLLLLLLVWETEKGKFIRFIGSLPIFIDVCFTIYYFVKDIILGGKRNYLFDEPAMLPPSSSEWIRQYFLFFMFLLYAAIACCLLYRIFENDKTKYGVILLIMVAGFISRIAMTFTPSIYASGTRTYAMLYFCFVATIALLTTRITKSFNKFLTAMVLAMGMVVNIVLTVIPYLQDYS